MSTNIMYTPKSHNPDTNTTAKVSADVVGGRVLEVSGNGTVAQAAAASVKTVGTAYYDAASGTLVAVAHGGIQNWTASANITAGAQVCAAADGKVRTFVAGTDPDSAAIGVALVTFTSGNAGACQSSI